MNHELRQMTDADVSALAREIVKHHHFDCRFDGLDENDLREAIEFYKNFNRVMTESKFTILKTFLTIGVGGIITLIIVGIAQKVKAF